MLTSPVRPRIAARAGAALACAIIAAFALLAAACGSTSGGASAGVTIEPLSPTAGPAVPIGGKPAAPAGAAPTGAAPADPASATPASTPEIEAAAEPTPSPQAPPAARASDGSSAPTEGRWIDVNVTTFEVRLMDGVTASTQIGPVGVGALVDTGDYASTQTGLFHVYSKIEGLAYDPPYDTYISDWVGFDPDKANGFHSFLKDKDGNVVDASTGRISNGCIRTGAPDVIYAWAEIGMPVWVHF